MLYRVLRGKRDLNTHGKVSSLHVTRKGVKMEEFRDFKEFICSIKVCCRRYAFSSRELGAVLKDACPLWTCSVNFTFVFTFVFLSIRYTTPRTRVESIHILPSLGRYIFVLLLSIFLTHKEKIRRRSGFFTLRLIIWLHFKLVFVFKF